MLTVFRGNRAEHLAELLAAQLLLTPPGPLETVQVVVNTWPTSRWLGEQLAVGLGGIAANIRYPFPGSQLRQIVNGVLGETGADQDPWRASQLVWPVLELLPQLVEQPEAASLKHWLGRYPQHGSKLELAHWQLGRSIADALDDLALYRPELLAAWWCGEDGPPLPPEQEWQRLLVERLRERLGVKPFGLQVLEAIAQLQIKAPPAGSLPDPLRLFGLSSLAPIQVQLLQALSVHTNVDLYLLTPCRDLWQRCTSRRQLLSDAIALQQPLDGDWLLQAPGLEARFGRLGGEFQQLLEGSGESLQGQWQEKDLFVAPASNHRGQGPAPLLHQLQQQLADPAAQPLLQRAPADSSLEFHRCPGPLRQVQVVRDRILQLLAADPTLQPRDVLVMTPQVDGLAPLVAAVFGDQEATGVPLNWRLTDRSQQSEASLSRSLLELLRLAGERLTASALETLLESPALQGHFQLSGAEMAALHPLLQRGGFHWGLDAEERGGLGSGSLSWVIDRLLLGLVLPCDPGLAPAATAPLASGESIELLGRWLHLLTRLRHWLVELRRPRCCLAWNSCLRALLSDIFGDGDQLVNNGQDWELPLVLAAIDDWQQAAAGCDLELAAPVVAAVLDERLAADSGRFGHRSGALTISALEPMRAIPHRVIVLMGLDANAYPRQSKRPGFHLLEQQRRLGDPNPADQDRYVLLEALLSARDHLLVTWSSRDPRSGEELPPATPVRQWLEWLQGQLPCRGSELVISHPANPLDRANFQSSGERPPASCDERLLKARLLLDQPRQQSGAPQPPRPLAASEPPSAAPAQPSDAYGDLRDWLLAPQASWLAELGLKPREWADSLDDLEPLSLDERGRALLLRQALESPSDPGLDGPAGWLARHRGQGLLPPQAAGELEAGGLSQRWRSLHASLEALGPERRQLALWQNWQQELQWRGSSVLVLHTAKPRSRHRLELWLALLLAAAADQGPLDGVLVARGAKDFGVQLRLQAPQLDSARAELLRLLELRQQWRQSCWPVPPETGWALLDKGEARAIETWEGGFQGRGERLDPEQALCFGSELSGAALLASGELAARAGELLGPMRERLI